MQITVFLHVIRSILSICNQHVICRVAVSLFKQKRILCHYTSVLFPWMYGTISPCICLIFRCKVVYLWLRRVPPKAQRNYLKCTKNKRIAHQMHAPYVHKIPWYIWYRISGTLCMSNVILYLYLAIDLFSLLSIIMFNFLLNFLFVLRIYLIIFSNILIQAL